MSESEKKFDIISVGDCVMDFFNYVDQMPKVGETLCAKNFLCSPGGKGANSIVGASRLGSVNTFVSKLGNDQFGKDFVDVLKKDKINTDYLLFSTKNSPTSSASIVVDETGHNFTVVNYGATSELEPSDVINAEEAIQNSKILVTTMMIKEETALCALKLGKKHGCITVFNFAPAKHDLDDRFNKFVDILIVNEIEAEAFISCTVKTIEDAKNACKIVLARDGFYIGCVVTLGGEGCVYGDKKTGEIKHFPCVPVKVVDTTGAGDSFVGALSHYISYLGPDSIFSAIELALEYASLSVTRKGTQASYWHLSELDDKFKVTKE